MPGTDVEVDQSGRTDRLTVDTILAFSNGLQSVILISRAVKRRCYKLLRSTGMRKDLILVKLLAAGLILLLEPHIEFLDTIAIDLEYPGWENEIKEHLLRYLRQTCPTLSNRQIVFRQIGKGSRAHKLALATYRGERSPDRMVQIGELLRVIT